MIHNATVTIIVTLAERIQLLITLGHTIDDDSFSSQSSFFAIFCHLKIFCIIIDIINSRFEICSQYQF